MESDLSEGLFASPKVAVCSETEPSVKGSVQELEAEIALYRHALEKSREELQAFAYTVSHDLRAPLRAIEGFSRILLDDFSGELSPDAQRFLKHIVVNTRLLGSQVDDLLKFYRLGKNPPGRILVDTNEVCRQTVAVLKGPGSPEAKVEQQDLPAVWADPVQLREIFSQLIANAFKFSIKNAAPRIEIGATVEPAATTFFVRDNGVGFDERHAHRLFQVFQKLHSSSDFSGNGIGLAIVKRLVDAHGGCVSAKGSCEGGATFYFSLPNNRPEGEGEDSGTAAGNGAVD